MAVSASQVGTPATDEDRLLEALEPLLARYRDTRARRESLALIKAVRLAPDLATCEALLRGERVHPSRLDPVWRHRYGR